MSDAVPQVQLYFDQDVSLGELLKVVELDRLRVALQAVLGADMRLLEPGGLVILGDARPPAHATRAPFKLELEPIGFLESSQPANLPAAVVLMEILAQAAARYFMAAAVQMESVKLDYEELQDKNLQLQASEERYRQLAGSLELRVAEQVKTIETTQRQLYQAEKLASVGQLAAGVAHEINNPLGFIRSNLNTAIGYVERIGKLRHWVSNGQHDALLAVAWQQEQMDELLADFPVLLQESIDGVTRVATIVAALKDFSSIDQAGETTADINTLLQNACQVAASEFGSRVRLVTDYQSLPALRCHAGRLSQVFMNLLLNAVQAISGPGEVRVRTASNGTEITVLIADSGSGIPAEVLARIFDPFFTTRGVGQGTGLGLTVARDVVQAHGGRLTIDSRPGVGTTCTIVIPVERVDSTAA